MADLMEIIKERRSIRKYQEKGVPEEALQKILESVQWSPSWANTQCWEVVVVKDAARKAKLAETTRGNNPAQKAVANAPVVLCLCAKLERSGYYKGEAKTKFGDWFLFDTGIATQSLCLTAHDLGLGTVIVGLLDHDEAKAVLGLGEGYEAVALIPLGYPNQSPSAPKRREIAGFTHYETFES